MKTKLTQLGSQLKDKDRLVDQLYQNTFITPSGMPAKSNLNKDVQIIIRLKRKLQEAKEELILKDTEVQNLKKDSRITKIRELEFEVKQYQAECLRLRAITARSIKLSGEIELD